MARSRGLTGACGRRAVDELDRAARTVAASSSPAARLSKGTAQKVGLAQALLRPPGLLVLDEPWEGLDAADPRAGAGDRSPRCVAAGGSVLVSDHRGEAARLPRRPPLARRATAGGRVAMRRRRPCPARDASSSSRSPRRRRGPTRGRRELRRRRASTCSGTRRGGPVTALVRMRLAGFLRTGRAAGPAARRPGGRSASSTAAARPRPAEAYGVSAAVLFPVLAWQTKILLDVEPDVQRRLAGSRSAARRGAAGRARSRPAWPGSPRWPSRWSCPWLVGGVTGPASRATRRSPAGIALGAVGAPAGRTRRGRARRAGQPGVDGRRRYGVAVLVSAWSARWCSA